MAICFMLAAECGRDEGSALRILDHFRGVKWNLSDGSPMYFSPEDLEMWHREEVVWCSAMPYRVSATGDSETISDPSLRVEVTKVMYQELRKLTGYRYAMVGWETASEGNLARIMEQLVTAKEPPLGLTISDDLWNQCGRPIEFERFGPGTRWKPLSEADYAELVRW